MFKRKLLAIAAFIGALSIPGVALAASVSAITTSDLNIRVGPGVSYARFATIPYGDNVRVHGCISGYNWCDVSWAGTRGWVSGDYLAYLGDRYYRRSLPSIAVAIGLPIIRYDYNDYYDRYYIGRHFRGYYFDRHHHRRVIRREHRRDLREERRERRQEVREDRRERRQEIRQDRRRERRQEIRQERRERRHEARQERRQERRQQVRENRRERRQEARQERRQERRELKRERRQERRERRAD